MRTISSWTFAMIFAVAAAESCRSFAVEIAAPTPVEIVVRSEVIVEGDLIVQDDDVLLKVSTLLKGGPVDSATLRLVGDSPGFGEQLFEVVGAFDSSRAIVCGELGAENGTLVLPWWSSSIWPQCADSRYVAIRDVDDGRGFVQSIVAWDERCRESPGQLLPSLVREVREGDNPSMVLAYVASWDAGCLPSALDVNSAVTIVACEVIDTGSIEEQVIQNMALIAPSLPPSVALKYFVGIAGKTSGSSARAAYDAGRAILRGRNLDAPPPRGDLSQLQVFAENHMHRLEIEDAKFMLRLFDSTEVFARDAADDVLEKILNDFDPTIPGSGQQRAGSTPNASRQYWETLIDSRSHE